MIRVGYGIFYGGLESNGGTNLGDNFPFRGQININPKSCSLGNCPSNGITLESGMSAYLGNGILDAVNTPGFHAVDSEIKTPYTMNYNLSFQRQVTANLAATISYVGNASRHLGTYADPNGSFARFSLQEPARSSTSHSPISVESVRFAMAA